MPEQQQRQARLRVSCRCPLTCSHGGELKGIEADRVEGPAVLIKLQPHSSTQARREGRVVSDSQSAM